MILSVHQPNFIPWSGFFYKLLHSDKFIILDKVKFGMRSYTNRTQIYKNKKSWLTLPIEYDAKYKLISEIRLVNFEIEKVKIINKLKDYYSNYPFYEVNIDKFEKIIKKKYKFLIDLNIQLLQMLIDEINIDKKIHLMSDFISDNEYKSLKGSDLIINLCQKINANVYLAGDGASKYDNINKYNEKNISHKKSNYVQKHFMQFNRKEFITGLSIIDDIFCIGFKKIYQNLNEKN